MSHIFDALQKSTSEGRNLEVPSPLLGAELLKAAERKAAAERRTDWGVETRSESSPAPELITTVRTGDEIGVGELDLATHDAKGDGFSQFQSLKVSPDPQSRLVCLTDKESLAAEKFRFLGVRLRQLRQSRPLKKLLITSTIPQEGKSIVAANLACTLASRTQQRTLLVDGDLRRACQAQLFGLETPTGLSEWLQGKSGPARSICRLEGMSLWMLPCGIPPQNPLELMQSGTLAAVMEQVAAWFDWIVIDSPPVLPLADTSVWMRMADGVLLVMREGITERRELQRGLEAVESSKLLGAIVNGASSTTHNGYYYHYRPTVPAAARSSEN